MSKKSVCLNIFPEKSCNRGCAHCGFESTMNGPRQSLAVSNVQRLVDEIGKIDKAFFINITGGGEPLLNEDLPQIVELFLNSKNIVHIDLVTSGVVDSDQAEIDRLEKILVMDQSQKLNVRLSFNEYNPTGSERFVSSLIRLIKSPNVETIKVAMRFSSERAISTHRKFINCLIKVMEILVADDIEIDGGLLHPSYDYYQRVVNSDFFSRHPWSRYIHLFVITQTLLMEIPYYLTSSRYSSKEIIVEPIFLHSVGRARYLKESPIMTMRLRQKKLPELEMPKLVVDHDGYYYPSYMCFYRDHLGIESICDARGCQLVPAATGHAELMRLGRVGGRSLAEAIEMEALLRKHAPENVVNTLSLDRDKCQICLENKLSLFGRCVS